MEWTLWVGVGIVSGGMETESRVESAGAIRPLQPRRWPRLQEAGLLIVIILLGVGLTLGGGWFELQGQSVNKFLRPDNLLPNVFTPMSWMAIMAVGVAFVVIAGGIDISVGSIFGLAALGTAAVLQNFPENASAWKVLPLAVAVPLGIGLACGLINGMLVVGLRMHPFIVTLGTMSIFRGIALVSVKEGSLPAGERSLPWAFARDLMMYEVHYTRPNGTVASLQPVPMLIHAGVRGRGVGLPEPYGVGAGELRRGRQRRGGAVQRPAGGADQAAGVCAVGAGRGNRGNGFVRVLRIGGDEHRGRL